MAAIALWFCLRLPSCGPSFESQSMLFSICIVKIAMWMRKGRKYVKQMPGLAHFQKLLFCWLQRKQNSSVPILRLGPQGRSSYSSAPSLTHFWLKGVRTGPYLCVSLKLFPSARQLGRDVAFVKFRRTDLINFTVL